MNASRDTKRRVVVTGIGVVTPIGKTGEDFWRNLTEGRSGISVRDQSADEPDAPSCAGQIKDFTGQIDDFGELEKPLRKAIRKALKVMNRETQLGVAAAQQALSESQLATAGFEPERIGVCFGTGFVSMMPDDFLSGVKNCTNSQQSFDFDRWGVDGLEQVTPLWLLTCLPNMPACHIAIHNDLRGPNNSITQREAAANLAIAEAWHSIVDGNVDAMLVGSTGTNLLPFNLLHSVMEQQLSPGGPHPETICRPFDRSRTGAVLAEGAAAVTLELLESALARGVEIYGEIVGVGSSCVVGRNYVPHCNESMANAMQAALNTAGLDPESVGHLHAHGLSTQQSDIEEAQAIQKVFGEYASSLPVVAAKSHLGNAGAGGGAIEFVSSLLALKHRRLFRVLNYDEPDPQCPLAVVTSDDVEAGESFLNLSVVPHGQASCVAVRAFNPDTPSLINWKKDAAA